MSKALCESVAVQVLCNGNGPPPGFVRRSRPVYPEFAVHAEWWPIQYHQKIEPIVRDNDRYSDEEIDQVWLWIPREDNLAYERGDAFRKRHIVHTKRWCESRIKITHLKRGKTIWFSVEVYFKVVSSIHSVLQAYPSRRIEYARLKRGNESGVLVRRIA